MTEKPNCGNCPFCDRNTGTWDYCNKGDFAIDPLETKEKIEIVGCLEHPGAREYLMRDVIKGLQKRDDAMFDCCAKRLISLPEAISLIRDGVQP